MKLLGFQPAAVAAAIERLTDGAPGRNPGVKEIPAEDRAHATVLVQATGTGKTICAIAVLLADLGLMSFDADGAPVFSSGGGGAPPGTKKILWMVGRRILVRQARDEIAGVDQSLRIGVEMAESKALAHGPFADQVVVASVESLRQPNRLARYNPDDFGLIIVDECHNGIANSGYHAIYRHFRKVRRLGLTATPFNAKGEGLGGWWDSVAYTHSLTAAIEAGDLVPIFPRVVPMGEIRLEGVDFNKDELTRDEIKKVEAAYLEEGPLHKMARVIHERVPRPAIIFAASVGHSKALVDVLNRYREDNEEVARHIDCYLDDRVKAAFERDLKAGMFSFASNYGILFEGVNWPLVAAVVFCAPTNRVRFVQGIGRATRWCCLGQRLKTGCTCGRNKTKCEIWDFHSNTVHDVASVWDALAPGASPEAIEEMERRAAEDPDRDASEIAAEVQKLAATFEAKASRADYEVVEVDLLDPLDEIRRRASLCGWRVPAPVGSLAPAGVVQRVADLFFFPKETKLRAGDWTQAITAGQAAYLIDAARDRAKKGLALPLQVLTLARQKVKTPEGGKVARFDPQILRKMSAGRAVTLINEISKEWGKP